jgi:hypothetical protein
MSFFTETHQRSIKKHMFWMAGVTFLSLFVGQTTEYIEYWPCPLFYILLNKYVPAG